MATFQRLNEKHDLVRRRMNEKWNSSVLARLLSEHEQEGVEVACVRIQSCGKTFSVPQSSSFLETEQHIL